LETRDDDNRIADQAPASRGHQTPGTTWAWRLAEDGRADEECVAFRRALSIDSNDMRAHYNLADTLDKIGRAYEAAPHWKAFLRQDVASAWATHARQRLAAI
jgi:thioredoxin-like negative regulator of GroEL